MDADPPSGTPGPEIEVLKVNVLSVDETASPTHLEQEDEQPFMMAGTLIPPYSPRALAMMYERSSLLRPNVEAYAVNIDGFGYRLKPSIPLTATDEKDPKWKEENEALRDALITERLYDGDLPDVDDAELRIARLRTQAASRQERLQLELFFRNCGGDESFEALRRKTRAEREVTGNAYWEVLRNGAGAISEFRLVPGYMVRLARMQSQPIKFKQARKITHTAFRPVVVTKRFRKFAQIFNGAELVWFKELGDPRLMSARTGIYYTSMADMKRSESHAIAANEMIHFKVDSLLSPYGVPRWIGATLAVHGSRASEEVNAAYFDNKGIPPYAILVSGGKLAEGAIDKIEAYMEEKLKGRQNYYKCMVLQASGGSSPLQPYSEATQVKIEMVPMTGQSTDALFQNYETRNAEKVGQQFRLPKLLRGDSADVNRATADAALQYADDQVFSPERKDFDFFMNAVIFRALNVRHWNFESKGVEIKDPAALVGMATQLVGSNLIVPNEGRAIAADALGRDYPHIDEPWARSPVAMIDSLGPSTPPGPQGVAITKAMRVLQRLVGASTVSAVAVSKAADLHQAKEFVEVSKAWLDSLVERDETPGAASP